MAVVLTDMPWIRLSKSMVRNITLSSVYLKSTICNSYVSLRAKKYQVTPTTWFKAPSRPPTSTTFSFPHRSMSGYLASSSADFLEDEPRCDWRTLCMRHLSQRQTQHHHGSSSSPCPYSCHAPQAESKHTLLGQANRHLLPFADKFQHGSQRPWRAPKISPAMVLGLQESMREKHRCGVNPCLYRCRVDLGSYPTSTRSVRQWERARICWSTVCGYECLGTSPQSSSSQSHTSAFLRYSEMLLFFAKNDPDSCL